jgi:hypothetical protein
LEQSKIGYDQMQHYGSLPYEAMYTGFFLNVATARWVDQLALVVHSFSTS